MIIKFRFLDPEVIMGVVVALVILAVGVFAFFVTLQTTVNGTKKRRKST